jgi:rubrerythrin
METKPVMTDRQLKLFQIFKEAIELERQEQEHFKQAAALCDDGELAAILESFRKQEASHEHLLLEKYKEYRERFAEPRA